MERKESTVTASFAMPHSLFQEVRIVARDEDLNLSILFRKMVRSWLEQYKLNKTSMEDKMEP